MSLMYITKSVGPGTEPSGTSALAGYYCWWVGCAGVPKFLLRAGWNRTFCVPGFIQGWGMQSKS